jgi:hypothetical protein
MSNSGQWRRGQSGNPAGRRPGSGQVAAIRARLAERLPEVVDSLAKAAVAGDIQAIRILLDRVLPPLRAEESTIWLDLSASASASASQSEKAEVVLAAMASGEIAPSQAAQLVSALGIAVRINQAEVLESRIAALETAIGKN